MTYHNYEFTAFAEADLLSGGDTNLNCGDTFTMPSSASLCITVCDDDGSLNGDNGWYDNQSEDHYGQYANIAGAGGNEVGNGCQIYAESYHWVQDQYGNRYVMIEIQQEGSHKDYFTFHSAYGVPPAGAQLTITQTCNVSGNWVDYKCLDAGAKEAPNGNICGRLTFDADCNDTEWNEDTHSWDEGVEGQTVQLLDLDGNVVAETTTDHYGSYDFSVPAGQYRVKFPELDGYKFSTQNVGSDGEDSDADATGLTDVVTVTSGQITNNVDAGIKEDSNTVEVCTIIEAEDMHLCGFTIGHDSNASGGEKILSGHDGYTDYAQFTYQGADGECDLTVRAFDSVSDVSYHWLYGKTINPSTEKVWVYVNGQCVKGPVLLNGDRGEWVDITVEDLQLHTGDVIKIYAAGDNCRPAMIDYVKLCCEVKDPMTGKIGDTVWLDSDRDGVQDAGEAGVAGVTVLLKDADGNVLETTTTDANGKYLFDNLAAGDYSVAFVPTAGTELTAANQGGDEAADSDADVTTGMTDTITLGMGEENLDVDAGLVVQLGSLSGRYFCDENRDGQDNDGAGNGLQGVTVLLYGPDGSFVKSTTTAADGSYSFGDLEPGSYTVRFNDSVSGKDLTDQNVGNDATDSDARLIGQNDTTVVSQIDGITVTAGQNTPNNDAGVVEKTGSISGTYFCDDNNNDIQDAGDVAIAGRTVQLIDNNGDVVGTTTTDSNGDYTFNDVIPGAYTVRFEADPEGKEFVDQDQGGDDSVDSDVDAGGTTDPVTVGAGEDVTDVDAGVEYTGALSGRYFCDENRDGLDNDANNAVANVTVALIQGTSIIGFTQTDANGNYRFDNLAPGTYSVRFQDQVSGKELTDQNIGSDDAIDSDAAFLADGVTGLFSSIEGITVQNGQENTDNDAGVREKLGSISGTYFCDENDNDVQDANEPGISGITVTLLNADGSATGRTTTTDANGNYTFDGLSAGDYKVSFDADPTGKTFVDQDQGGDDTVDSDVDSTGTTNTVTLGAGEDVTDVDAGVEDPATASISGTYFCDENDNDVQDANEPGISGITVTLLNADGSSTGRTTTTDQNGNYTFGGLTAGDYKVSFDADPTGKTFVDQDQGGDDTVDSDVDNTGTTDTISVGQGDTVTDVDAGVEDPATAAIKGRYFCDENDNDVDDGEPGIAMALVRLLDASGTVVGFTMTDLDGNYEFTGLEAGDYKVVFSAEGTGKTFVDQDQGSDDTIDSDVDVTGTTGTISLNIGEVSEDNDAGVEDPGTAAIEGRVFCDENNNDVDDGEPGVGGVTVNLLNADGSSTGLSTVTAADGSYSFTGLDAGSYIVDFDEADTDLEGKVLVAQDQGGDDTVDSDASQTNGQTGAITVAIGETSSDNDAGVEDPGTAAIEGRYFCDEDDNDVDDGEPGIAGARVTLLDANGDPVRDAAGNAVTTTTDSNGNYSFTGLMAGTYGVLFAAEASGKEFVAQNVGSDDTVDSDADATTGIISGITVEIGETSSDNDAGVEDPGTASVGDTVWLDSNGNGLLDDNEQGVDGVTVKLLADLDGDGQVDDVVTTTTTANGGQYLFDNLDAGDYAIMFNEPAGFDFTTASGAAADAVDGDSDAGANGMTGVFNLSIGEAERDVDAGVVAENGAPTPADDAAMTCANTEKTVDVLANDSDPEGDSLTITAVDGKAIVEGQTITTDAGTLVTLSGGQLIIDGEAAYVGLDIGDKAVEDIAYTVSDGNGGSASAALTMTFCGTAETVAEVNESIPTGTFTYQIADDFQQTPAGENAYDLQINGSGDARFDGVVFDQTYCISFWDNYEAGETFADAPVVNNATMKVGTDGSVFDDQPNEQVAASAVNGQSAADNLDLVNWILSQDFESQGYSEWEIQFAIWDLTDNWDPSSVNSTNAGLGLDDSYQDGKVSEGALNSVLGSSFAAEVQQADVDFIVNQALANGEGFAFGGANDTSGLTSFIVCADPSDTANQQPFIFTAALDDIDCLC